MPSPRRYLSLTFPVEESWTRYNSLQQLAYFITVFVAAPTSGAHVAVRRLVGGDVGGRAGMRFRCHDFFSLCRRMKPPAHRPHTLAGWK
jgi:hypothetical protein